LIFATEPTEFTEVKNASREGSKTQRKQKYSFITVPVLLITSLLPCIPPLPPGEGWGEGRKSGKLPDYYPLILAFSRREKGFSFCFYG
jgi:hypothetical protein